MAQIEFSARIDGVAVVVPEVHSDARGRFLETWRKEWIPGSSEMVQANRADRQRGALVGMHYHLRQSDYWYVPFGRVLVALFDLRTGSPTRGAPLTLEIGEHDHRGVFIPPGVAHGFYSLTDMTITYLVDHYYDPADELGVAWNDPHLGIAWPGRSPVLSQRDQSNSLWADIPPELLPS